MKDTQDGKAPTRIASEFNLVVGQIVEFAVVSHEGRPVVSEVIGIDNYLMAGEGGPVTWVSYTLRAVDETKAGPWDRWWAVNVPDLGPHFYRSLLADEAIPADAPAVEKLTGLVKIESEGDASLSTEAGYLRTYRTAKGIYAEEQFYLDESEAFSDPLRFIGIPKHEIIESPQVGK